MLNIANLKLLKFLEKNKFYLPKKQYTIDNIFLCGGLSGYGLDYLSSTYAFSNTICISKNNIKNRLKYFVKTHSFRKEKFFLKIYSLDIFCLRNLKKILFLLKHNLKKIDKMIYSISTNKRFVNKTKSYNSVLKPLTCNSIKIILDATFSISLEKFNKVKTNEIFEVIKIMGGEYWYIIVKSLMRNKLLQKNIITVCFSYSGPRITDKLYRFGTIGFAKKNLFYHSLLINKYLKSVNGHSNIIMSEVISTKSSFYIPSVTLYYIIFKLFKTKQFRYNLFFLINKPSVFRQIKVNKIENNYNLQLKIQNVWFKCLQNLGIFKNLKY